VILILVVVFVAGEEKIRVLQAIGREVPSDIGVKILSMSDIVFEYCSICHFHTSEGNS
jgi:hypothetical protein